MKALTFNLTFDCKVVNTRTLLLEPTLSFIVIKEITLKSKSVDFEERSSYHIGTHVHKMLWNQGGYPRLKVGIQKIDRVLVKSSIVMVF